MPKISVIVPVYNVEEYLPKCLDSLINQTLEDIEIICINDGSLDNSLDILQAYAKMDNRIIVLDKENEGQGIARNLGIQKAKGEYIGFVDPDDWVGETMYEEMYIQAKTLSSEIVVCDFWKKQDWNGKAWKHNFWWTIVKKYKYKELAVPAGANLDKEPIYKSLLVSPCYSWNKIYNTKFLKINQIEFSKIRCFEDCEFIIKCMAFAKKISYLNKYFYIYRLRKSSTLHRLIDFNINLKAYADIYETLKTYNLEEKLANNFNFFCTMNAIWTLPKLSRKNQKEFIAKLKGKIPTQEYKYIKKTIFKERYGKYFKIINKIFSIKNSTNKTHKVIIVLGIKVKFKRWKVLKEKYTKYVRLCLSKLFSIAKPENKKHKIVTILGMKFKFTRVKKQSKKERTYLKKIQKEQRKFSKDSYLLFDCLHDKTVEGIDAYSLFLYMKSTGKQVYYVVLKNSRLYEQLKEQNKLENIIVLENETHSYCGDFLDAIYEVLLRCKCVITSFGENSAKVNNFFKQTTWLQYIFIQHGPTHMPVRVFDTGYLFPEKFDKFLISSDMEYKIFQKYGWEKEKLIKVGLPRWDLLRDNKPTAEKSILLMLTWRRLNAQTFEESLYKKNLLSLINNQELTQYLVQHNIKLYFAPHHALATNSKIDFRIENKNIKVADSEEISQYIKKCSCLVTDFSSVAFDFMFQDKPVIFYPLDYADKKLGWVDRKSLDCFDYKKYIMPNVVFEENDVIDKIKHYVENGFQLEAETKTTYDKFFYTKENIRQKLVEEIDKACA